METAVVLGPPFCSETEPALYCYLHQLETSTTKSPMPPPPVPVRNRHAASVANPTNGKRAHLDTPHFVLHNAINNGSNWFANATLVGIPKQYSEKLHPIAIGELLRRFVSRLLAARAHSCSRLRAQFRPQKLAV